MQIKPLAMLLNSVTHHPSCVRIEWSVYCLDSAALIHYPFYPLCTKNNSMHSRMEVVTAMAGCKQNKIKSTIRGT